MNTAKSEWLRIRALYEAAIKEFGWNDVRTIALEDLEAEACERYLITEGN